MPLEYHRGYTIDYGVAMDGKTLDCKIYRGHRRPRTHNQEGVEGLLMVSYLPVESLEMAKAYIDRRWYKGEKSSPKDQTTLAKWVKEVKE